MHLAGKLIRERHDYTGYSYLPPGLLLPSHPSFLARPQRVLTLAYLYVFTALSTLRVWEHRISQCLCRASSWNKLAADSSCGGQGGGETKGGLGCGQPGLWPWHHRTESCFVQGALHSNSWSSARLSRSGLRTDLFLFQVTSVFAGTPSWKSQDG